MGYSTFHDIHAQHRYEDVVEIQKMLADRIKPDFVIELGTAAGGITWAFCDAARLYGGKVFSFDFNKEETVQKVIDANEDILRFVQGDLIFQENQALVDLIKNKTKKIFLYCDNGFKEMEMLVYGQYLKDGDIMGCHDYGSEVDIHIADQIALALGLERFEWTFWEGLASPPWYPICMSRFWVKKHPIDIDLWDKTKDSLAKSPNWVTATKPQ